MNHQPATDQAIAHVGRLRRVQRLYVCSIDASVRSSFVTDVGLECLRGLTNVSSLTVHGSVADAELVHLAELTSLSKLILGGTQVTDAGLAHLKRLTRLSVLILRSTQVTDAGVAELQQALPNLKIIR